MTYFSKKKSMQPEVKLKVQELPFFIIEFVTQPSCIFKSCFLLSRLKKDDKTKIKSQSLLSWQTKGMGEGSMLSEYEELFKSRYTEDDPEFKSTIDKPLDSPPCLQDWFVKRSDWHQNRNDNRNRDGGNRDRGYDNRNRGGYRGGYRDNRDSYRDNRGYDNRRYNDNRGHDDRNRGHDDRNRGHDDRNRGHDDRSYNRR